MTRVLQLRVGEESTTSGYTLVELLVVLGIISLAITASPAVISSVHPGAQAKAEAYAFADALRKARSCSILNNQSCSVMFNVAQRTYFNAPGGRTHRLPSNIEWELLLRQDAQQDPLAEIQFFPDGSSSGGSVRFAAAGRSYRIVDHPITGRISFNE